jgi:hypothetical protein
MVLFWSGILCWCWKNPWTPIWNLYDPWVEWPWSGQSPKIQVWHDGALSIRKLILNKAQLIISLFVNWRKTKKCAPYFRGNMEFPIYLIPCMIDSDFREWRWTWIEKFSTRPNVATVAFYLFNLTFHLVSLICKKCFVGGILIFWSFTLFFNNKVPLFLASASRIRFPKKF